MKLPCDNGEGRAGRAFGTACEEDVLVVDTGDVGDDGPDDLGSGLGDAPADRAKDGDDAADAEEVEETFRVWGVGL